MQEPNQPHPWAQRIRPLWPLWVAVSVIAMVGVVATVIFALRGGIPRGTTPQSSALTSRTVFITSISSPAGGYTGPPTSLTLTALTSDTGKVLWQHSEVWNDYHVPFAAVVVPGVVYMVGDVNISAAVAHPGSSVLLALRAGDGSQLWHLDVGALASQPVVAIDGNTIYISAQKVAGTRDFSKIVFALNAHDGSVRWHTELAHTGMATDSLTLSGGRLFLGASEFACSTPCIPADLFVLDAHDGQLVWHRPIAARLPFGAAAAAVDGDVVYYPGPGPQVGGPLPSSIFAYSASDGHALWHHVTPIGAGDADFVVAEGIVYTAEFKGSDPARPDEGIYSVVALDGATGAPRWWVSITPTLQVFRLQVLALQGSRLYVKTDAEHAVASTGTVTYDETLTVLDRTNGQLLWQVPLGPEGMSLQSDAGTVYVGLPPVKAPGQGVLLALNGSDGSQRWKAPADPILRTYDAPALMVPSGGLLFFQAFDNTHLYVYAARASDGQILWRITMPNVITAHRLTTVLGITTI